MTCFTEAFVSMVIYWILSDNMVSWISSLAEVIPELMAFSVPSHYLNWCYLAIYETLRNIFYMNCGEYIKIIFIICIFLKGRYFDIDIDSTLFNMNTKTAQIMWCDEINSWNKNEWQIPPWSSFGQCIYVWRLLLRSLTNRWRRSHQKKEKEDIQG